MQRVTAPDGPGPSTTARKDPFIEPPVASASSPLDRLALFRRAVSRATPIGLFLTFALLSGQKFMTWATSGHLGVDLRIYRAAAEAGLAGANPWHVIVDGYYFGAPPPSLLPYIPAALLPEDVATVIYAGVMTAAAVFAIRALELPIWWVLFPPVFESLLSLNPDVLVLACLLGGPALAGSSVAFKIYGAVPLVLQRRWRALAFAAAIVLLSLPWWGSYFSSLDTVRDAVASQNAGLSAWGTWLMIPVVIALGVLRSRGAEWLVVPALWPFTQLHYSAIATPAAKRSPLLAFLLSFGIPLLPPIAVIAEAARVVVLERLRARGQGRAPG